MSHGEFAEAVIAGCRMLKGSITSWGRTPARNRAVGGSPTSRHLEWLAVDVVYDEPMEASDRRRVWEELGLHFWPEGNHDHISLPEGGHF